MKMDFALNGLIEDTDISSFGLIAAVSKADDCTDKDFDNIIQILDESGDEVNITNDNIEELFAQRDLSSIIL